MSMLTPSCPVRIFCSHSREDAKWCRSLRKHLSGLIKDGVVSWQDSSFRPGIDRQVALESLLHSVDLMLLLVSPDFIDCESCFGHMRKALEGRRVGACDVIPVLLRPVIWDGAPFADLAILPRNGVPICSWRRSDDALYDVAAGIRGVAIEIMSSKGQSRRNSHDANALRREIKELKERIARLDRIVAEFGR